MKSNGSDVSSISTNFARSREAKSELKVSKEKGGSASKPKPSFLSKILAAGLLFCGINCIYILCSLQETALTPIIDIHNEEMRHRRIVPIIIDDNDPILQLLNDAGIPRESLDQKTLRRLPTWLEVESLYGPTPKFVGLDSCLKFQTERGDPGDHFLATAGTFNTGTNLMAQLLINNCHMPARMVKYGEVNRGVRWQVPWGKHTPVNDENYRQQHKTVNDADIEADAVFPVVTIRDPAVWAASMCRHPYNMVWTHSSAPSGSNFHCPNLVPNQVDIALDESLEHAESIPVNIVYADFNRSHPSLIHHWNDFYNDYMHQEAFPRLIVRFEDIIFHPKEVTQAACECAGGEMNEEPFVYILESAKKFGGSHGSVLTGYLDAIIKYGTRRGRWNGMTPEDLEFAEQQLDAELMELFQYKYPHQ